MSDSQQPANDADSRSRPPKWQADMILTAESGWSFGELGYGPDRKAELRRAIDQYREQEGLEPVQWDEAE